MVGWSLLTDTGAIKPAGVPILRSLNIQFRLKQQALTLEAHLPREKVAATIPQAFPYRIDSGELFTKNFQYRESLEYIPTEKVALRYKMPVLALVHNPDQTMLVER